jgi:hypothetical protein
MKKALRFTITALLAIVLAGCVGSCPKTTPQTSKIRIQIEATDLDSLFIKGDEIWMQMKIPDLPVKWLGRDFPVKINGSQEWLPKWNGHVTLREIIKDSPPIPDSGVWNEDNFKVDFHINGFDGRASVRQYPSDKNDHTLIIEFDDTKSEGAHWYVIDINW